jgi:allantoin racemase
MKIWHQSFTDLDTFPRYAETLQRHAQSVVPDGVTVDVHGLVPKTYPPTVAPMDFNSYPYLRYSNGLQVCQAVLAAETLGYDAVALGCFFDPALREARSLVDIPVVSLSETSFLTACSLGRRFAVISLSEFQARHTEELASQYGVSNRLAGVFDMSPNISLFELEKDSMSIKERFESACTRAISKGAEVIIPGDGVLNAFLVRSKITNIKNTVITDPLGTLFHHAIYFANLRKHIGLTVSRQQFYSKPQKEYLEHSFKLNETRIISENDFSKPKNQI